MYEAPQDQDHEARGEGADEAAHAQAEQPGGDDAPDPEEVRDAAVERDADGGGERIAGYDPPHRRRRGAELCSHDRYQDVEHRGRKHRGEDRQGDHRQEEMGGCGMFGSDRFTSGAHRAASAGSVALSVTASSRLVTISPTASR